MAALARRRARVRELEAKVSELEERLEQARRVFAEQQKEIERLKPQQSRSKR